MATVILVKVHDNSYPIQGPWQQLSHSRTMATVILFKDHDNSYPILQKLAELFLGMSEGSVPVE